MDGEPTFFTQLEFREWLEKNHDKVTEFWLGYYKVGTGKPSLTWSQSVDEALCFGWIDGLRKTVDKDSYKIRFTPRKPTSIWSAVNIRKMKELQELGLMKPSGLAAFAKRDEKKSAIYSFEQEDLSFPKLLETQLKANKAAWDFYQKQAPSYKKSVIHWLTSAKQEATIKKRMGDLIEDSANGRKVKPFRPLGK